MEIIITISVIAFVVLTILALGTYYDYSTVWCVLSILFLLIVLGFVLSKIPEDEPQLEAMIIPITQTVVETEIETIYVDKSIYTIAEEAYGVPADILEGIERWETGHYTSQAYLQNNNTHGAMINGELIYFSSHAESTFALARNLKYNYFAIGLTDLPSIQTKYCPEPGCENWASGIQSIINTLHEGGY